MTWQEALEILREQRHTHAARYAELCADDGPLPWAREKYRANVIRLASGEKPKSPPSRPVYPPVTAQIANAFEAAGRFVAAWWKGEPTIAETEEMTRRLGICFECDQFDHTQKRCPLCGCFAKFKAKLAKEHCPLPPEKGGPKW